jgi:aldehyde dehydrogenase (NAD+)
VAAARAAQPAWGATPAVARGRILRAIASRLEARAGEVAAVVAAETGKSPRDALGETLGAVALGHFMAGEGQRLYGRTTTSAVPHRMVMTVREPVGVTGLVIAANTPIANVAWKAFPALVCGNAAVLKAAEDTPMTAWLFAEIAAEAGLPPGLLDVVQGLGAEAGRALVAHPDVDLVSFTGSTAVGREIQRVAGERLARTSLELGGKNPFVVCADADLEHAVRWASLSAFSNAGQRCAAASRIIVDTRVYDAFRSALVETAAALRVGPSDADDLGPVINERQLARMDAAVEEARARGSRILTGGTRLTDEAHAAGSYYAPTVIEGAGPGDPISRTELFGPIACLYGVDGYDAALALANDSPYGLTAAIHTRCMDRALHFVGAVRAGVAVVNAGTFGSEPHMPFGGVKASGNGTREPGTEALDVYSNLKNVCMTFDPAGTHA